MLAVILFSCVFVICNTYKLDIMAGFHSAVYSHWIFAIVILELAVHIQAELYIYSNSSSLCQYNDSQNSSHRLDQYPAANQCFLTYDNPSSHHLAYLTTQNLVYASRGRKITITHRNKWLHTAVEKAGVVTALSVDWASKNIYWAEKSGNIWVATYLGKFRRKLMKTANQWTINGLLAEPNEGYLYWTSSSGGIYRSELNGQHVTPFITEDVQKPMGIAIDYNESRLYWLDSAENKIESVTTNGTDRKTVATLSNAQPMGIALNQNYVIWTDQSPQRPSVNWTPKDSRSNHKEKTLSTNAVVDVILYGTYSQPETIRNQCAVNSGGCSQLCLPGRLNSSQCFCGSGYKLDTDGHTCIQDTVAMDHPVLVIDSLAKSLYEIDVISGKVKAIPMDAHMNSPFAVDLDQSEGIIFWSDTRDLVIKKSDLNGRNVTTVKTLSAGSSPEGIAVDDKTKKLFYVDASAKRIMSMDYNGGNEAVVVSNGHDSPRDIVLDTNRKKIYWSDWGADRPSIKTASYTGSDERVLVDSDIMWPNGLALDDQAEALYWCDGKKGTLESIRTDGTGRSQLTSQVGSQFWGITLVGSYLYVTDENEMYLQRIHKHGSGTLEDVSDVVLLEPRGIVTVYKGKPVIEKGHRNHVDASDTIVQSIGVYGKAISTVDPASIKSMPTATTESKGRLLADITVEQKGVVVADLPVEEVPLDNSLPLMVIIGVCVGGVVLLAAIIAVACIIIYLYGKRSSPATPVLSHETIYLTQPTQIPPLPQATAVTELTLNPMLGNSDITPTEEVEHVYCEIPPDVTANMPRREENGYLIPVNNINTNYIL